MQRTYGALLITALIGVLLTVDGAAASNTIQRLNALRPPPPNPGVIQLVQDACRGRHNLLAQGHVLYALYGTHHQYGNHVLLYIGMTEVDLGDRLVGHIPWVNEEWETMRLKAASVGAFDSVEAWWDSYDPNGRYPKAETDLVREVESLLIYAHQPAYNTQGKNGLNPKCRPLPVFNTGKVGTLLPELSCVYYRE